MKRSYASRQQYHRRLFRRAAISCLLMALLNVFQLLVMRPVLAIVTSSATTALEASNWSFVALAIMAAIGVPIELLFGYYILKIGRYWDMFWVKSLGIVRITVSAASVFILFWSYEVFAQIFTGAVISLYTFSALSFLCTIAILFTFIMSAWTVKSETNILLFRVATWVAVPSLLLSILFPLALALFGIGLDKVKGRGGKGETLFAGDRAISPIDVLRSEEKKEKKSRHQEQEKQTQSTE